MFGAGLLILKKLCAVGRSVVLRVSLICIRKIVIAVEFVRINVELFCLKVGELLTADCMDAGGLFSRPLTEKDFQRPQRPDIFNLGAGLSKGERLLVQAAGFKFADEQEVQGSRRYERVIREFERFAHCGDESLPMDCERCRSGYFVKIRCRSRLCETCNRAWAKDIEKQLLPELGKLTAHRRRGYVMAHVVLTVGKWWGEDRLPGTDEIKLFAKWCSDFTRLHYGKYVGAWSRSGKVVERRKRFQGGAWVRVLEFGLDNNNLHAHLIVYGPIKPKTVLDASWSRITECRGRWIWIERLQRPKQAIAYVMKYLVKAPVSDSYNNLAIYALSIKGTRRLATGGVLYGRIKSKLVDPNRPRCRCAVCGERLCPGEPVATVRIGSRLDLWAELWERKREELSGDSEKISLSRELPAGVIPITRNDLQLS